MKIGKILKISSLGFLVPFAAFAQDLQGVAEAIREVIDIVIPALMALAVAVFFYGIVKYILSSGDSSGEKEARGYITWGLVGVFVLACFWGLIEILANTLGIGTDAGQFRAPQIN
jgi:TRAP-type C4-dicarboxylate transport system permease small subunit